MSLNAKQLAHRVNGISGSDVYNILTNPYDVYAEKKLGWRKYKCDESTIARDTVVFVPPKMEDINAKR